MTPTREVEVDTHTRVGPYTDIGGHGPITAIGGGNTDQKQLAICMDCGYVTRDTRMFVHEDCDREDNPINMTWREFLNGEDYPDEG